MKTEKQNPLISIIMENNFDMMGQIGMDYAGDSRESQTVRSGDFYSYLSYLRLFVKAADSIGIDKTIKCLRRFRAWHDRQDWLALRKDVSIFQFMVHRSYALEVFLFMLWYRQFKSLGKIGIRVMKIVSAICRNNKYYKWHVERKKRAKEIRSLIDGKYKEISVSSIGQAFPPYVISIFDGTVRGGGLADRLRGGLSTYAICKKRGLPFRLYFTDPFDLQQFLVPNVYDWRIDDFMICRNTNDCDIIILDTTENSEFQFERQGRYLDRHLRKCKSQIQVFTNAAYAYTLDYSALFHELFQCSERLSRSIEEQKSMLGSHYISVSARFLDLLGDFNETFGYGESLPEKEAQQLIRDSVDAVSKIHEENLDVRILVNSDSVRFLEAVNELNYTYVIPGNVTHIDGGQEDGCYERYEKTFLDFLMIAEAKEIILIRSRGMGKSGYPYAASLIYNRPFREVEF